VNAVGQAGIPRARKPAAGSRIVGAARHLGRAWGTAVGPAAERRAPRLRSYLRRGLTAFVFHEITDQPSEFQRLASIYTTPALLEQQLRWIRERFEIIAPTRLGQLGAEDPLPENAALVTFDDAWAGVFRTGLPILDSLGVPALCFINTATVEGAPDLAAVRYYERRHGLTDGCIFDRGHGLRTGMDALEQIAERYRADPQFAAFQGPAATAEDLSLAASSEAVWFGAHLHHHWDLALVDDELFEASLEQNLRALEPYGNRVPAFAPPYGRRVASLRPGAQRAGARAVFLAGGGQNRHADRLLLDRITLPIDRDSPADWWYETHRLRVYGPLARH
jgi:peptidoglycan/xylan/chitin deacetylase (PgdA/CDA1 family)